MKRPSDSVQSFLYDVGCILMYCDPVGLAWLRQTQGTAVYAAMCAQKTYVVKPHMLAHYLSQSRRQVYGLAGASDHCHLEPT